MKFKTLLMLSVSAVAVTTLAVQGKEASRPIPVEAAKEMNKDIMTRSKTLASSRVDEDIKAYCRDMNIVIGKIRPDGTFYLSATERVSENQKSPHFIQSRAIAYEKACLDAMTKYVMDQCGKNAVTRYNEYFKTNDRNRLQPSANIKTAQQRIAEKTEMLTEAQLDQGLKAMGVMPSGSIIEKRKLAVNSILGESLKQAIGSVAGLLPVQTFEGWNDSGNYAIGVVMRGGVETATIADCISSKRRPVLSLQDKGMSVEKVLPSNDELISQFGVRLFFDETGTPALLGFGQWGVEYSGDDDNELEDAIKYAKEQAKNIADAQLITFINSTASINDNSKWGEEHIKSVMFDANGGVATDSIRNHIDTIGRNSKISGVSEMKGSSTVRTGIISHPQSGLPIAVCVRMWSFGQYEAIKRLEERPEISNEKHNPQGQIKGGVRRGRAYDF